MTPEQKALRDRMIAALRTLGFDVNDDSIAAHAALDMGLRMVGDDEVVVKRSSIREGWLHIDEPEWFVADTPNSDADVLPIPAGVISPWPPEDAS